MATKADVFVTIASYDDQDTPETVRSLLADPGLKVRVHVVLQTDDDGLQSAVEDAGAEVLRVERADARGIGWPRAVGQLCHLGETFWLQCDAHMRFVPGWASTLAGQQALVGDRAALSSYPLDIATPLERVAGRATIMRLKPGWIHRGWLSVAQEWGPQKFGGRPAPARTIASGFLWAPAGWLSEVLADPYIYFGDEPPITVRAWTHGWDLFHPARAVCTHNYQPDSRPRHWADFPKGWYHFEKVAQTRCAQLFGWEPGGSALGIYGLGHVRSLAEFEQWAGVDFAARTQIDDAEWRCS